nr:hypothetical protein PHKIIMPN_00076 [Escherichia coli]WBW56231.1 hypothetical protein PHKIIMPN_00095 [Escherichia coli]
MTGDIKPSPPCVLRLSSTEKVSSLQRLTDINTRDRKVSTGSTPQFTRLIILPECRQKRQKKLPVNNSDLNLRQVIRI